MLKCFFIANGFMSTSTKFLYQNFSAVREYKP